MAKREWGSKRLCQGCGARFYDLQREPIVCPKCGVTHQIDVEPRSRRSRPQAAEKPKKRVVEPVVEEVADVAVVAEGDEAEDVIEDASELGEDEEIDEVAEKIDEKE